MAQDFDFSSLSQSKSAAPAAPPPPAPTARPSDKFDFSSLGAPKQGFDFSSLGSGSQGPKPPEPMSNMGYFTQNVWKSRKGQGIEDWVNNVVKQVDRAVPVKDRNKVEDFAIKTAEAISKKGGGIADFALSPAGGLLVAAHLIPYTRWAAGLVDVAFAADQGFETAKATGNAFEHKDSDSAAEAIADGIAAAFSFKVGKEGFKNTKLPELSDLKGIVKEETLRELAGVSEGQKKGALTQGILRQNLARAVTNNMRTTHVLSEMLAHVDTLTSDQQLDAIHAIETSPTGRTGVKQMDPKTQQASDLAMDAVDKKWDQLIALKVPGIDQHFYENYMPRFYKEFEGATQAYQQSYARRPFTGSQGFRQQRTILGPIRDMVDPRVNPNPPLHLVTNNLVELSMMKIHEMEKFEMAIRSVRELVDNKLIERVSGGQKATDGYKKINDRIIPKAEIPQGGSLWAPEEVAKSINNFLAPGLGQYLQESVPGKVPALLARKGVEGLKNFNNASARFLVSWSAFHAGLSTAIAMSDEAAVGFEQLSRGNVVGSAKSFARSLGWAPVEYFMNGKKLMAHAMDPTLYPQFSPILERLQMGGGRPGIDTTYRSRWTDQMFRNWVSSNAKKGKSTWIPKAMAGMTNSVMEKYVPRLKIGAAMRMFEAEAEKWGPGWETRIPVEVQRAEFGKIVDSIDNRHGQLVYDNTFWPRTIKDIGFLGMQFMGFTMGTVREAAGGALDLARMPLRAILKEDVGSIRRASWTILAMPMIAGMTNAIAQYYMTGTMPDPNSRKIGGVVPVDYMYPWNGKYLPNGEKERITLPPSAYLRTLLNPLEQGIGSAITGKLSNALAMTWGIFARNADYHGVELWNSEDPFMKNVSQELAYGLERMEPIPVQRTMEDVQAGQGTPLSSLGESFLGISNAPVTAMRSHAQNLIAQYGQAKAPQGPTTEESYDHRQTSTGLATKLARKEISPEDISTAVTDGRITKNDGEKILRQHALDPWDRRGYWGARYLSLTPSQTVSVWRAATSEERKKLLPIFQLKKYQLNKERNEEVRVKWVTEFNKLLAEYQAETTAATAPPENR